MSDHTPDFEQLLERTAAQVRDASPTDEQIQQAADRVWQTLSNNTAPAAVDAAQIDQINGCEDYQRLIPAYLAGQLPQARKMLVEDHTRECVPCRRALKAAREGRKETAVPLPKQRSNSPMRYLALAAMMILGLGAAFFLAYEFLPFGTAETATVKTVDGQLFRVASTSHLPLTVDEVIRRGDILRTGRDGGAVVELEDGSLVELRARSEIAIHEGRSGTTIDLARGNVIVQAAPQRERHLFVATNDCLVSVTGTIFSVNHGTKGSRVSVIEGEVRVQHGGDETVLQPGQQIATQANLNAVPVKDEIAWSRDVDHYLELLEELNALRQDLDAVPQPELRYSSRLLDLMPEDIHFFAAVPNFGETVDSTYAVLQQSLEESPMLGEWWTKHGKNLEPMIDEAVDRVSRFAEFLGDEIAVGGNISDLDTYGPLVLADVTDADGLRAFIAEQIEDANWIEGDLGVVVLEDLSAPPANNGKYLFVWIDGDVLAASPDAARLQDVARVLANGTNPFVGSEFHQRIAELYTEGAGVLAAADLEAVIDAARAKGESPEDMAQLERTGLLDVHHLMLEHKKTDLTENRAVLTFREARQGIASWIDTPAPMGSLDFISPDAKVVGAVVFKDPVRMLEDLETILGSEANPFGGQLDEVGERLGLDIREDFAAVLGGEMAFAFDGPLVPEPAWKLIVEIYDTARFQWAMEQALAKVNDHLREEGKDPIEIRQEDVGGQTYFSLPIEVYEIHYTFVEGYLVAAPNRALLDRAIRFRDSGYSIAQAPKFAGLLPNDGRNNYSAIFYQDLGNIMQAMAESVGQLSEEQQQRLEELTAGSTSTLGYAYAEEDRIIVAATNESGLLGTLLMQLAGLQNPAGLADLFTSFGP